MAYSAWGSGSWGQAKGKGKGFWGKGFKGYKGKKADADWWGEEGAAADEHQSGSQQTGRIWRRYQLPNAILRSSVDPESGSCFISEDAKKRKPDSKFLDHANFRQLMKASNTHLLRRAGTGLSETAGNIEALVKTFDFPGSEAFQGLLQAFGEGGEELEASLAVLNSYGKEKSDAGEYKEAVEKVFDFLRENHDALEAGAMAGMAVHGRAYLGCASLRQLLVCAQEPEWWAESMPESWAETKEVKHWMKKPKSKERMYAALGRLMAQKAEADEEYRNKGKDDLDTIMRGGQKKRKQRDSSESSSDSSSDGKKAKKKKAKGKDKKYGKKAAKKDAKKKRAASSSSEEENSSDSDAKEAKTKTKKGAKEGDSKPDKKKEAKAKSGGKTGPKKDAQKQLKSPSSEAVSPDAKKETEQKKGKGESAKKPDKKESKDKKKATMKKDAKAKKGAKKDADSDDSKNTDAASSDDSDASSSDAKKSKGAQKKNRKDAEPKKEDKKDARDQKDKTKATTQEDKTKTANEQASTPEIPVAVFDVDPEKMAAALLEARVSDIQALSVQVQDQMQDEVSLQKVRDTLGKMPKDLFAAAGISDWREKVLAAEGEISAPACREALAVLSNVLGAAEEARQAQQNASRGGAAAGSGEAKANNETP